MAEHHDVFEHIRDFAHIELPHGVHLHLPSIGGFQITKFMLLQSLTVIVSVLIFRGLAKRVASGGAVRGPWWNFWETLALYIRDEVVRPTIGSDHHVQDEHEHQTESGHGHAVPADHAYGGHSADRFLPYIWSCFFYVLFGNLLGAFPWLGSPTGNLSVTAMLALATFVMVVLTGVQAHGFIGFWKSLVPSMDLSGPVAYILIPLIWVIEVLGLVLKHFVLAMRLFANMMAGHTVVAVILAFIAQASGTWLFYLVAPASVLGQVGIGLLELLFAFIQAYIFAFLSTLFISMAQHAH